MSDQQAAGVLRVAARAGSGVPQDIAVTGWDGSHIAAELGLTAVAQSMRSQGRAAAAAALDPAYRMRSSWWKIVTRHST